MNGPIPVTVVTGFLGSGKTTLLTSLVRERQSRRLAILINEFGQASIDGAIVRHGADSTAEIQIHDFPHGLIAYGDDARFVPTMVAIAARRAHVDHVLIETSGLALPTAVMETLQTSELARDFILDATLAVVDTPLLLSNQFDAGDGTTGAQVAVAKLFVQQLKSADIVVLNKIDTLDESAWLSAEARVRQLAPNIRFLELARHARLDVRLTLGLRLHQPTFETHARHPLALSPTSGTGARFLVDQRQLDGHSHSGCGAHTHGLLTHKHFHEHDPGWLSFMLNSTEPQETARLEAALIATANCEPVLRTKGFVRAANDEQILVQGVRTRVTLHPDKTTAVAARSELVFIGYHLNRANVAARLTDLTGTRWN